MSSCRRCGAARRWRADALVVPAEALTGYADTGPSRARPVGSEATPLQLSLLGWTARYGIETCQAVKW